MTRYPSAALLFFFFGASSDGGVTEATPDICVLCAMDDVVILVPADEPALVLA